MADNIPEVNINKKSPYSISFKLVPDSAVEGVSDVHTPANGEVKDIIGASENREDTPPNLEKEHIISDTKDYDDNSAKNKI